MLLVCLFMGMLLLFSLATPLDAIPLGGTYTVGGVGANYLTLTAALNAAQTQGLGSETTFRLNAGTYSGPFEINLPGNQHYLNIRPADGAVVTLDNPDSNSSQNYVFYVNSTPKVSLYGLSFSTSGSYSRSVYVYGESDGLHVDYCSFQNTQDNYANGSEAIVFTADGANDADDVRIALNSFYYGYTHISAGSYSSNTDYSNWTIYANYHGHAYYGVYLQMASNISIQGQIMEDVNSALYLTGCAGTLQMERNRISAYQHGVVLDGCSFGSNPQTGIVNNIVNISGTYWYNPSYYTDSVGIYVSNCSNVLVYHNSVRNSSRTVGSYALGVTGTGIMVRKNILASVGTGYAMYSGNLSNVTIEYNNLWSSFSELVRNGNSYLRDILAFNTFTGSPNISYYPFFTDDQLRTVAPKLDDYGPAYGVGTDFHNFPRSASNPDIGAHEFASDPSLLPLSGTYTVGVGQNYATLGDFFHALSFRGVSSLLTVQLTDTLYVEQVEAFGIPGSNPSYLVQIFGNQQYGSTFRWDSQSLDANYVLRLNRMSHLDFHDIRFQTASTQYANLVWMPGYNTNVRFLECRFIAPVGAQGSSVLSDYQDVNYNLALLSCGFYNNLNGLRHTGDLLVVGSSWFIGVNNGISLTSSNQSDIAGNYFQDITSAAVQTNGGKRLKVYDNQIIGYASGFQLYNLELDGTQRNLIYNNTIHITGGNQRNGITLGGNGINLLNNSVQCDATNSAALYMYSPGSQIDVVNNILQAGPGLAIEFAYYTASPNLVMDYNCYYSMGNSIVRLGSNYYDSLAGLRAGDPANNVHSLSLKPHFTADMHTQSPWLRHAGIQRAEFDVDMDLELRGTQWDIGADQQTGPYGFTPLSGSYNVGPGGHYPTLAGFISDLGLLGTNGDVTANLLPGIFSGYNLLEDFPRVIPGSRLNFISQPGASFQLIPQYTYSYENYIFKLQGADHVTFSGISFTEASSTRQCYLFLLEGKCDDIEVLNCGFTLSSQYSAAIYAYQTSSNGLKVYGCTFNGGSSAVWLSGQNSTDGLYQNVRIEQCSTQGTYNPFTLSNMNNLKLISNSFTAYSASPSISNLYGNSDILRNKFRADGFIGAYSTITMLSLTYVYGTVEQPIEIVANVVYSKNNQVQAASGIAISNGSNIRLLHNSMIVENKYAFQYGSALAISSVNGFWAANNIFSSPFTGYALTISQCTELTFNNNAYFDGHLWLGKIDNTNFAASDLIYTQLLDANGVFADPMPDANGYTTCQYLGGRGLPSYIASDVDIHFFASPPNIGATYIAAAPAFSGTVTVGPSGDFTSLNTALAALMSRGISGNTQLVIQSGFYTLNMMLGNIPNTLVHRLTITGAPNAYIYGTASSESANYALGLRNVRNITLEGLNIAPQNQSFSRAIAIERYSEGLSMQACHLTISANTINSDASAGIYVFDAILRDLSLEGCQVENFSRGLYLSGSSLYPELNEGMEIMGNSITGSYYGVAAYYQVAPILIGNSITGWRHTGINFSYIHGAARIERNTVKGNGFYGMLVTNYTPAAARMRVATNYFSCTATSWGYAMQMDNCQSTDVYFNTFRAISPSNSAYGFYQTGDCNGLSFVNNLARGSAGYAAVFPTPSYLLRRDHNLFYTSSGAAVKWGNTDINTFGAWMTSSGDNTSIFADPLLNEDSYTFPLASPAYNAATVIDGYQWDILANYRDNPDIGCWEYTGTTLATPQNISISMDPATLEVLLGWDAVPGATSYTVYYAATPDAVTWMSTTVSTPGARLSSSAVQRFYKVRASN